MTIDNSLAVVLTRCRHFEPLATVRNLPGRDADLRPDELRSLAAALLRIADDCERRPTTGKNWQQGFAAYTLDAAASSPCAKGAVERALRHRTPFVDGVQAPKGGA